MKKIWDLFDNMNEFVYVSDADSYELIYMNKKLLQTHGFHSLEEIAGKKCYEVLQNSSEPCAICTNHELSPGCFKEWGYYNPILGRHLVLKDTMIEDEGRRCRVEIALDAEASEWQNSMLHRYQDLEVLVNEGLRIALQADTPDKTIGIMLEYLGKALNAERTYIFEKNETGGDDNTYEWVGSGVTPEKDNLQNLPPEICANWYHSFSENKKIVIEDLEDIHEENPMQYEILKQQNIRSLAVVPLYNDQKIIGFYGVDNPPAGFLDYAFDMLQIMGHFITSSLKRRNLVKMLQHMSYTDQLTKFGNRYAMDEHLENMTDGESVGVVFCDVTGLKRINDTEGHKAGDKLLLRACESLRREFNGYELFRIGGDEFLVLCPRIEEETLKQKAGALKRDMQKHSVSMAVGAVWQKDGKKNIDKLLSESEKLMYKDKAAYYRAAGIDRRG
ncbi:MAG: sensor domain-containing diguanylate cyclase [Lachnospiraceae bacterium]|nr:sensor domain-containing diguanylate cyclase [Lachnospiraceae bacterium]